MEKAPKVSKKTHLGGEKCAPFHTKCADVISVVFVVHIEIDN